MIWFEQNWIFIFYKEARLNASAIEMPCDTSTAWKNQEQQQNIEKKPKQSTTSYRNAKDQSGSLRKRRIPWREGYETLKTWEIIEKEATKARVFERYDLLPTKHQKKKKNEKRKSELKRAELERVTNGSDEISDEIRKNYANRLDYASRPKTKWTRIRLDAPLFRSCVSVSF